MLLRFKCRSAIFQTLRSCQSGGWRKQYKPTSIWTNNNEPNNAGYNGIPCGATYGAGTYQWINTCGYRACLGRGYTVGMVQEYSCLDSTCGAVLTCF